MKKATGIDLAEIDVSAASEIGHEFEVIHPESEEGLGVFIKVRGEEAATVRLSGIKSAAESIVRNRMKAENKKVKKSFEAMVEEQELELHKAVEETTPEKAAERIISWRGVKKGGVEIPATRENCIELFMKAPFIQAQVFEESRRLGNFFPAPSMTSANTPAKSTD